MPPKNRGRGRGKGRGRGHGKSPGKSNSAISMDSNSNLTAPRVPLGADKPIFIDDCDVSMESPLTKFVNITGAEESIASNYLMMCDDDLNEAIAAFYQYSESESTASRRPENMSDIPGAVSSGASCVLSPNSYEKTHGVRAPLPRTKERLIDSPDNNIRYNGKRKLPESIFDSDYAPANPSKKTKKLHDLYKAPLDITFKGSFEQAKQHAKESNKLLLVNIQDMQNFDSHLINREIWRETRVRELLSNNFTMWQIIKDSPDAQWFTRFYNVDSLPYIAILDSTTGNFLRDITTTNNCVFLSSVENFLTSYLTSPSCRLQGLSNITIEDDDEEMSASIAASLSQQENGVISNPSSPTPAPTSSRSPEINESLETPGVVRSWVECDYTPRLVPGAATTRILIRCLNGERRSVTFSQTQPIKELLDYLSSHGMDTTELEVVAAFPRMVLNTLDPHTSFKDANLAPSATIFIQYQ